jgi:hypothetical protein
MKGMIMDPYQPPESNLYDGALTRSSVLNVLGLLVLIVPATLFASWILVPKLNSAFAELLYVEGTDEYWNIRYGADIFNTFLVYIIGAVVSAIFTRDRPFLATLPIGCIGLAAFLYELGGLHCLGKCGPPLWYDLLSLLKHLPAVLMVGGFFWFRNKSATPRIV